LGVPITSQHTAFHRTWHRGSLTFSKWLSTAAVMGATTIVQNAAFDCKRPHWL
jgi:hypothetical protein